jgi:hypothetical protein
MWCCDALSCVTTSLAVSGLTFRSCMPNGGISFAHTPRSCESDTPQSWMWWYPKKVGMAPRPVFLGFGMCIFLLWYAWIVYGIRWIFYACTIISTKYGQVIVRPLLSIPIFLGFQMQLRQISMALSRDLIIITANEKHRYGVQYELISELSYRRKSLTPNSIWNPIWTPSDIISEWFFATITVHIGVISEMHTPNSARRSEKQRKKRVGPDDFYVKMLSDMRSDMN